MTAAPKAPRRYGLPSRAPCRPLILPALATVPLTSRQYDRKSLTVGKRSMAPISWRMENGQAEALAEARGRKQEREVAPGIFLGQAHQFVFPSANLLVVLADNGHVGLEGQKRLLGTWQSDRQRTLRTSNTNRQLPAGARKRRYVAIFGELVLRFTPKFCYQTFDDKTHKERYDVVAEDDDSIALRCYSDQFVKALGPLVLEDALSGRNKQRAVRQERR